ncbi:MAG TPA: hypothetical protein VGC79_35355, partial [Polyangiaceae bacterium]
MRRALARVTFTALAGLCALCAALPAHAQAEAAPEPVVEAPAPSEGKSPPATDTWGSGDAPNPAPEAGAAGAAEPPITP